MYGMGTWRKGMTRNRVKFDSKEYKKMNKVELQLEGIWNEKKEKNNFQDDFRA